MLYRSFLIAALFGVAACSSTAPGTHGGSVEASLAACNNAVDDDGDGFTDCADQDCANISVCANKLDASSGGKDAGDAGGGQDAAGAADSVDAVDAAKDSADVPDVSDGQDASDVPDAADVADVADVPDASDVQDTVKEQDVVVSKDLGAVDSGPVDSEPVDTGPADSGSIDGGSDVPAACKSGESDRCYVECSQDYPPECIHGDLPPRILGIRTCQAGQWGGCKTLQTCDALKPMCVNASKFPSQYQCLDGKVKDVSYGCTKPLGAKCTAEQSFYANWPISDCKDLCQDDAAAQCDSKGAERPCEVHCDSADGPIVLGKQSCWDACSPKLFWGPCLTNDACTK